MPTDDFYFLEEVIKQRIEIILAAAINLSVLPRVFTASELEAKTVADRPTPAIDVVPVSFKLEDNMGEENSFGAEKLYRQTWATMPCVQNRRQGNRPALGRSDVGKLVAHLIRGLDGWDYGELLPSGLGFPLFPEPTVVKPYADKHGNVYTPVLWTTLIHFT